MNLGQAAPFDFLRGFMHIHKQHTEVSETGGPLLASGYYLGQLQLHLLECRLEGKKNRWKIDLTFKEKK